uniref:Uncharacterized protein n=1 Tax=Solanum tuberosum TaxID=4113 RepID=M1CWI8_SOLTU
MQPVPNPSISIREHAIEKPHRQMKTNLFDENQRMEFHHLLQGLIITFNSYFPQLVFSSKFLFIIFTSLVKRNMMSR